MDIQGPLQSITDEELDLLREIGSQSGATAANSISKMMNSKVLIEIPQVHTLSLLKIPGILGDREKLVAVVTTRLQGDIQGQCALVLVGENVRILCGLFDSNPVHDLLALSEYQKSSLIEIGNIIIGSFTRSLADKLKLKLLFSVPRLSVDMVGAILQSTALKYAAETENVLSLDVSLSEGVQGHILVTIDDKEARILLSRLKDYFVTKASL